MISKKGNPVSHAPSLIQTKLSFTILSLFALLVFSFVVLKANAQEEDQALNLTVTPPVIELVARPGEQVIERFRVRNNNSQPIILQIEARRLISDPTEGSPIPENEAQGEELEWVTFDRPEFTANPQEWQDVTFTIDIPQDAAFGYYYVFRISPKEGVETQTTGAAVRGELLVVTLLNVLQEGALSTTELVSFGADNAVSEHLPVNFSVKLKNTGNIHVKPQGNIFISRGGGDDISILDVNANVGSILPGGTREFEAFWNDGFIVEEAVVENGEVVVDEDGQPVTKVNYHWNKLTDFRFGPYEAKLLMVYDDGEKDVALESVTTFWVVPYKALIAIAIGIIVLVVLVRFALKWYVGQAIKKSRK